MKGSCHYKRDRWYVNVFWNGKRLQVWRYNGEPIWHEKTATKLLNKIRSEIDDGIFEPKAYFPKSPLSINEYVTRWLKLIDVKPNTLKDYSYSIRRFIIPFFGDKDIRRIRHADLIEFQKSINRCEKGKYNVMSCLRTLMRWAWRNEDIQKVPPFPRLTQGNLPVIEYLTFDQQQNVLKSIPDRHKAIFEIGMEYGLRIGEMRAIQWDCITETEIIIKRAFAENLLMESTKTGTIRTYGLTPYAREMLNSISVTSNSFVFVRDDGKPYTDKNLNALWAKACEASGVKKIKLYNAIRHSLGCQLLDQGVDFDIVQGQLGHTRPEMTRRYAKRSEVRMMDALVNRRAKIVEFARHLPDKNKDSTI